MDIHQNIESKTWYSDLSRGLLGAAVAAQGRYAEAKPLLISGCKAIFQRLPSRTPGDRLNFEKNAERLAELCRGPEMTNENCSGVRVTAR